jgi:hypothetical protein
MTKDGFESLGEGAKIILKWVLKNCVAYGFRVADNETCLGAIKSEFFIC